MTAFWVLFGLFALWLWLRGHWFGGVLATLAFVSMGLFLWSAFYPPFAAHEVASAVNAARPASR